MAKAPADPAKEMKELLAYIKLKPINFAMLMDGKTPVIRTDKIKKPAKLRKEAKAGGGGMRGCSGKMVLKGREIELRCIEQDVPDPIIMAATRWLKDLGFQFKFVVIPGAENDEPDEEDDSPAVASAPAGPAASAAAADAASDAPASRPQSATSDEPAGEQAVSPEPAPQNRAPGGEAEPPRESRSADTAPEEPRENRSAASDREAPSNSSRGGDDAPAAGRNTSGQSDEADGDSEDDRAAAAAAKAAERAARDRKRRMGNLEVQLELLRGSLGL